LYDFPAKRIHHHLIAETPVRTSSLRGLGATLNVFAIESFMDELALEAGEDPVAYRLSILKDPRARAVIEKVAEMSSWPTKSTLSPPPLANPPLPGLDPGITGEGRVGGSGPAQSGAGKGRGIAFARYKNIAAYAA